MLETCPSTKLSHAKQLLEDMQQKVNYIVCIVSDDQQREQSCTVQSVEVYFQSNLIAVTLTFLSNRMVLKILISNGMVRSLRSRRQKGHKLNCETHMTMFPITCDCLVLQKGFKNILNPQCTLPHRQTLLFFVTATHVLILYKMTCIKQPRI